MADGPMKRPVNRELEMMMPVIAETMKLAIQALSEAGALAEVLTKKGIVTKTELDAAMTSTQKLREKMLAVFDEQIRKQS